MLPAEPYLQRLDQDPEARVPVTRRELEHLLRLLEFPSAERLALVERRLRELLARE